KARFIVNCGISKSFFNKTLNIKLTMSDILNQQINALQIVAPDTDFKNLYHFDNRELSLSVRYYLNATKNRYKGKPAGQDVMNRL
ncbi:MAG: outer membrane beta-barrel protein, partial [Tannerellaceae bacterium]